MSLVRVVNKVASDCDAGAFDFFFLWSHGADKTGVGWFVAFWHFVNWDEIDGVGALNAISNALGESSKFICC